MKSKLQLQQALLPIIGMKTKNYTNKLQITNYKLGFRIYDLGRKSASLIKLLLFTAFLLISLFAAKETATAQRTASVSGNWSNTATWGGSAVPTSSDAVTINSGIAVTVDISNATCLSLTFAVPAASNSVTISGSNSLTTGAITYNRPTSSYTSTLAVGAGTLYCSSIALNGGSSSGRTTIVSLSTGTINCTGGITYSNTAAQSQVNFTGAGTINIGGSFTPGALTSATGCLVNFNGGAAQSAGAFTTYYNVSTSTSSTNVSLSGTTTITNNLSIADGTTFTIGAYTLTVTGTTTIGGGTSGIMAITSTTGTKTFTGLVTINNGGTWNNSGNSAITFSGGITLGSSV